MNRRVKILSAALLISGIATLAVSQSPQILNIIAQTFTGTSTTSPPFSSPGFSVSPTGQISGSADASLITTGTFSQNLFPGSVVYYPAAASFAIGLSNNGGVSDNVYSTPWTATLASITGTGNPQPNAYQYFMYNGSTTAGSVTASGSTTINGSTSAVPIWPKGALFLFADGSASPGNYLGINLFGGTISGTSPSISLMDTNPALPSYSASTPGPENVALTESNGVITLGATDLSGHPILNGTRGASSTTYQYIVSESFGDANTTLGYSFPGGPISFTSLAKGPIFIPNSSNVGVAGQGWINAALGFNTGTLGFGTNTTLAAYFDTNGFLNMYQGIISTIPATATGTNTYPLITLAGGCTEANGDTSGRTLSVSYTNGSNSFGYSATQALYAGEQVTLATAVAPYTTSTFYYISSVGLSTTTFQLAASYFSLGTPLGNVTASSGSVTLNDLGGNYIHQGGLRAGNFTIPASAVCTSGVTTITLTFPNTGNPMPFGWRINASDESGSALPQTGHTRTYGTVTKSTVATIGDVISFSADPY